jgi:hypothetical protein
VTAAVVALDAVSYEVYGQARPGPDSYATAAAQEQRALTFALAEYDVKTYQVQAGDDLGAVLA